MAIPNVVSVSSIYGTTVVSVLTTTLTTTQVTAASDKVHKINLIRCANITDSDATVTFDIEVSGTHKMLANEVTVPANSVVDIIDKNSSVYLQETDLIRGGASAGTTIDCVISYEIMDDAYENNLWLLHILDDTLQEEFGRLMTLQVTF